MANLSQSIVLLNLASIGFDSGCLFITYPYSFGDLGPSLVSSEYTKNEAGKALGKNKGKYSPHETHKNPRNKAQI